ncbi:hypothetical protein ACOMHN_043995 [Nucella lapillus]
MTVTGSSENGELNINAEDTREDSDDRAEGAVGGDISGGEHDDIEMLSPNMADGCSESESEPSEEMTQHLSYMDTCRDDAQKGQEKSRGHVTVNPAGLGDARETGRRGS